MGQSDIALTVQVQDDSYQIMTHTGEYRNLMSLIYDKVFLQYFGDCKGMARCGTCIVEILQAQKCLPAADEKEQGVLRYCAAKEYPIRLSCQLLLTEDLHGAVFRVVEQI